jgi:uncharacterized protein YwqG
LRESRFKRSTPKVYAGEFHGDWEERLQSSTTFKLLFQWNDSEANTGVWGDSGVAQVWMETGENYGGFFVTASIE